MATDNPNAVLEFDSRLRKVRINAGVWVYFKGCTSKQKAEEAVEKQKQKDKENPPPDPQPTDRDGYLYCDAGGTQTYHWVQTVPPYSDTDLFVPC